MSDGNLSRRDKLRTALKGAVEDRTRERAEEANRPKGGFVNYSPEFTAFTVSPAKTGGRVVRLLGMPLTARELGSDCKIIRMAWIRGANGKKWPFVFPTIDGKGTTDKSFILKRLIDKVLEGKWNTERKARDYFHAGTPIFNLVKSNGHPENEFEQGWDPSAGFLINCIDRSRMDWHRTNKKTLVLSKNYSPNQDPAKPGFYDVGVAPLLYKRILDDVVEYDKNGDWEEYDVVLRRQKDEPFYYAFHGPDEPKKTTDAEKALIQLGPLTAEERSWELWDFDRAYPVSSYKRIFEHVGSYFKIFDAQFNTQLYDELKALVDTESKNKSTNTTSVSQSSSSSRSTSSFAPAEDPVGAFDDQSEDPEGVEFNQERVAAPETTSRSRETSSPRTREEAGIPWDALSDGSYNGTRYLGVIHMTTEEKAAVVSVDLEKGPGDYAPKFKYRSDLANDIWNGLPPEKFPAPGFFKYDPLTGVLLPPPTN